MNAWKYLHLTIVLLTIHNSLEWVKNSCLQLETYLYIFFPIDDSVIQHHLGKRCRKTFSEKPLTRLTFIISS